jgi:pSer/pThr/pTyr-binding forkhead associated (FHA) protein
MPSLSRRKIVGILISYSWHPDGKVFPVYEERNLIGRGEHCQIHVPEDTSMSDENSHIFMITRNQKYLVGDKGSLNGTYLNGERILEMFHPLPNYALIRAGSTDFTFMMVQPPPVPAASNREGS